MNEPWELVYLTVQSLVTENSEMRVDLMDGTQQIRKKSI